MPNFRMFWVGTPCFPKTCRPATHHDVCVFLYCSALRTRRERDYTSGYDVPNKDYTGTILEIAHIGKLSKSGALLRRLLH